VYLYRTDYEQGGSGGAPGGMDSSLTGQMFMLSMNKGFCNDNGPCTILAGKAGVQFADGSKADTGSGLTYYSLDDLRKLIVLKAFISITLSAQICLRSKRHGYHNVPRLLRESQT
jgi:hypothetical protein